MNPPNRGRSSRSTALGVVVLAMAGLLAVLLPPVAMGQALDEVDWIQIGADVDGAAAGDNSGWSVATSSDGTRIVIGAPRNDGNGRDAGQVRVYDFDGTNWAQIGADINGEAARDWSGHSVAMSSDGNRIAIGAIFNAGERDESGHVRIYDFDGTNWNQTGPDINGESLGGWSGYSVAMSSDGNRIAIGAIYAYGNNSASGQVRVYDFDGTNWNQTGTDINGEAEFERSGESLAMSSDGNHVTIGASADKSNGYVSGPVRVYGFDGTNWTQTGTDINSEAQGDEFGKAVAMSSDGNRIAIGAPSNSDDEDRAGYVRVYDFDGTNWTQTGTDINGEAAGDRSGESVAMSSDGNRIAIGANLNDGNGDRSGHVQVYDFDGTNWTQTGTDINGEAAGDRLGESVAMSSDGNRIAIGAIDNDGNNANSGHVRAYELMTVESRFADGDVVVLNNVGSGRYLDGDGVHRAWNVDTSPTAKWDAGWRLGDFGDGTWTLRNRRRSRYLDADGSFLNWNVGQSVTIGDDDRWEILDNGDGTFLLHNARYGRYLAQASTDNKNVITVTEADIDELARWEIAVAP